MMLNWQIMTDIPCHSPRLIINMRAAFIVANETNCFLNITELVFYTSVSDEAHVVIVEVDYCNKNVDIIIIIMLSNSYYNIQFS